MSMIHQNRILGFFVLIFLGISLLACTTKNSPKQSKSIVQANAHQSELQNLALRIVFLKPTYVPGNTGQGEMEIYIKNLSGKTLEVYLGNQLEMLKIYGQGAESRFPQQLNFYQLPEHALTGKISLENNQEKRIIALGLHALFEKHIPQRRGERPPWIWDWEAATISPPSPVHTSENTFEKSAEFWVVLTSGMVSYSSEKVQLSVKR